MKLPEIPQNLDDWSIDTIDALYRIPHIESEAFDFKKEQSELDEHICSMANHKGGILVLGIAPKRSEDSKHIIGFVKSGFSKGREEIILNQIADNVVKVEPRPKVDVKHISEKDDNTFYTVIKIESRISDKPYFVTTTDQCFVRLHNSKRRASRSFIFNLFAGSLEQRKNLESLRSACSLIKESVRHIIGDIQFVAPNSSMKIPILDLTYLRSLAISCEWFLKENNLWGEHTKQNSYTHGINSMLHELELMNTYIKSFNDAHENIERQSLKTQLSSYRHGSSFESDVITNFDNIITTIDEFLEK